ncbi:MAG: biotin--[acetyl-CoA-carboxylase] ligase [Phycisphaerales bacterium]
MHEPTSTPADAFVPSLTHLERVTSTNDAVRRELAAGVLGPIAVYADVQTAGRGTRGRAWDSPAGAGLYFSWGQRAGAVSGPSASASASGSAASLGPVDALVTPAAGIAAAEALIDAFGAPVFLKPVNDLVVLDDAGLPAAKLGGILAESSVHGGQIVELVIGVGVNLLAGPRDVASGALPATSIESLVGIRPDAMTVHALARSLAVRIGWRVAAALGGSEFDRRAMRETWDHLAVPGMAFPRPESAPSDA